MEYTELIEVVKRLNEELLNEASKIMKDWNEEDTAKAILMISWVLKTSTEETIGSEKAINIWNEFDNKLELGE